jgi:hypothetical protein
MFFLSIYVQAGGQQCVLIGLQKHLICDLVGPHEWHTSCACQCLEKPRANSVGTFALTVNIYCGQEGSICFFSFIERFTPQIRRLNMESTPRRNVNAQTQPAPHKRGSIKILQIRGGRPRCSPPIRLTVGSETPDLAVRCIRIPVGKTKG